MAHHNHSKCKASLFARAEQTCGKRLTAQRKEVLGCVAESHVAVGAYELIERMAIHGSRPAPITVYRALDFLLDNNLVHKVESRNAFVACSCTHGTKPPTLLICQICGSVDEIVEQSTNDDLHRAACAAGFKVNRAVIELTGTCKVCSSV
jgi:Fur family transcriptional regulator, zinc uptake regulator